MAHLNTSQAAERLGVSARFLEDARAAGTGPAYFRLGRRIAYAAADLDAWLSAQRRPPMTEVNHG